MSKNTDPKETLPQDEDEALKSAIETIKGAHPCELFLVAAKITELELRGRAGDAHPPEAYERAALLILAGHIKLVRELNLDSAISRDLAEHAQLAAMDLSKMAIN